MTVPLFKHDKDRMQSRTAAPDGAHLCPKKEEIFKAAVRACFIATKYCRAKQVTGCPIVCSYIMRNSAFRCPTDACTLGSWTHPSVYVNRIATSGKPVHLSLQNENPTSAYIHTLLLVCMFFFLLHIFFILCTSSSSLSSSTNFMATEVSNKTSGPQ